MTAYAVIAPSTACATPHIENPAPLTATTAPLANLNPAIVISAIWQQTPNATNVKASDTETIVDIYILNSAATAASTALPDRVEGEIILPHETRKIWLKRAPQSPSRIDMPPNGFAQARYQMKLPDDVDATKAVFSFPIWSSQHMMMAKTAPTPSSGVQAAQHASQSENDALLESKTLLDGKTAVSASPTSSPAPLISGGATNLALTGPSTAAPIPTDRTAGNEFFGNFAAYEPIYAVYGPGTNTDARIQISFKYRLFGSRQDQGLPSSWRDGLHLAYTQRMFWDLGAYSMPFRNIDYQPELFYLTPSATYRNGVSVAGQIGLRHESNGRDGPESRSINSIYVAPMASFPLTGIFKGDGYSFTIAPRLALTVGSLSDNPDIMRYRGNTSMVMEIGKDDGWRITTSSRFNFASGKGAASLDLSYPLAKLLGGGPDFYIFGQSFIGYGENLLDYNRHVTRFRIGVALIR